MQMFRHTLGEICDKVGGVIRTGPFGTHLHQSDYQNDGIPVVMPKDIADGKLSEERIVRVATKDIVRLFQHILKEGDIVYGRRGDIGRQALITKKESGWLCGTGCLRLSLGSSVIDSKFLHYYLMQEHVIGWIYNQAIGATMPNLNTAILRSVPIEYPSLSVQKKIAAILSAYDDLIGNNTRRIKILDEMARAIYREWFVNFRFPGYGMVEMVDCQLGKIPAGWECFHIGEVIETLGGGTPSTKVAELWQPPDVTWFTPSDLTASDSMFIFDSSKKISREGFSRSSAKLFPANCVMMTSRATIGIVSVNTIPACTNQGFITCVPNEQLSWHQIYNWILENKERIISIASGATYKEISRSEFRELPIVIADVQTRKAFIEVMEPLCDQIKILLMKNINLRQTRDLLLTRLISGEVDVSELDIAIHEETRA